MGFSCFLVNFLFSISKYFGPGPAWATLAFICKMIRIVPQGRKVITS